MQRVKLSSIFDRVKLRWQDFTNEQKKFREHSLISVERRKER